MRNAPKPRPFTSSYDSGYEHSLEHWIGTRRLFVEANEDAQVGLAAEMLTAVRDYAYRLYEQRGHENGRELDDWLRAEGEVLAPLGLLPSAAFKYAPHPREIAR